MNNPAEIQEFLRRLFSDSETVISNAKAEEGETDTEIQLNLKRTIENGLSKIQVVRSTAINNALVPSGDITDQFATPQAFVDAVIAFIEDPDNDIDVTDGVITNTRVVV